MTEFAREDWESLFSLKGQTAVVTGGCGILGQNFARGLAAHGARVGIWDLAASDPKSVAEKLASELGADVQGFECDLGKEDQIEAGLDQTEDSLGPVSTLISNAAAKSSNLSEFFKPAEQFSLDTWREITAINLDASFVVMRNVARRMIERKTGGSMVQISSIYGVVAPDRRIYDGSFYMGQRIDTPPVYAASKAGVLGLVRYFAAYWAEHGIRVNAISPGGVESGQNDVFRDKYANRVPMRRMAEKHEMVGAAIFLASQASSYVTGQNIVVDGGLSAW